MNEIHTIFIINLSHAKFMMQTSIQEGHAYDQNKVIILLEPRVSHFNVQEVRAHTQQAWATLIHMFRKFQPKCRVLKLTYPLTKETMSLLSSRDSQSPILLFKSLGTMSRPMFKNPKTSPKDFDKPHFNPRSPKLPRPYVLKA